MVTILQSKTPNSISCTSKNTNFYQKKIVNLKTDSKHSNIDRIATSSSDKCLSASPTITTKIYCLPSKDNLYNSSVQSFHNQNITKHHLKEREDPVESHFDNIVEKNRLLDSSSSNTHEKPIEIQSFRDTLDSASTTPSTTPSTPTTPSSTSSKDIDPFDESLLSIKNTLESKNCLKNLEISPSNQINKTLSFSNHYTTNNLNKTFNYNNSVTTHPKINITQSKDTTINNNMHSEIIIASSPSINRKDIHNSLSSINSFDSSSYITKNSSKVKKNINNNHFKNLCLQLLEDLLSHSDAGPFLNSIEDNNNNNKNVSEGDNKENCMEEDDPNKIIKDNHKVGMKSVEEKTSYNLYSIQRQLSENKYKNLYGVFYDLQKMLLQCYRTYTNEDHFIHRMGKNIEEFLIGKLRDMPEKFINQLKEQCFQDYQQFKNSSKSSTKYPVLPAFLEVIKLPLLVEKDFEFKEDRRVIENSFSDYYMTLSREDQIKECKRKKKKS